MPQTEPLEQTEQTNRFGLNAGMTVEVMSKENRLIFVGKVDSCTSEAVVIRDAKGDDLPPVLYNKEIKLRFFRDQSNVILQGKICGSTSRIWKLDRLESTFTKEQRAFFRQRISLDTWGMCYKHASPGSPARRDERCKILDISAGGMLISSAAGYRVGERLEISGVRLVEREPPFTFRCRVRRVGWPEAGSVRYGCQFESLPPKEQDKLLRAIFTIQREEIKRQKEQGDL